MGGFVQKYKEPLAYLFWGLATTAVNYLVYFSAALVFPAYYVAANIAAGGIAVVFAFWANKVFVFRSRDWSVQTALPEFLKFTGARIFSLALETGLLWLLVEIARLPHTLCKVLLSILVVLLNYFFSKLLIFIRR